MNVRASATGSSFIGFLLEHLGPAPKRRDSGMISRMKRSDNPDTDWQAWETLVRFGVNLEDPAQRLPYCVVGASLCREDRPVDGMLGLGAALRLCFYGDSKDQGSLRLRRMLACTTTVEVCTVLRPVLSLIRSKAPGRLCHAGLLEQLLHFESGWQENTKARWARDFWNAAPADGGEDA